MQWCWIDCLLSAVADELTRAAGANRASGMSAPILTLGAFQLLDTPLLLSLLWFFLLVSTSSLWFLSPAVESSFLALTQQWPTSLRCVSPYLVPRLSILSCVGTRTKYGLEIPFLTDFWTYLSSLRAHCAMHSLFLHRHITVGEYDGSRSHLASSVGLWHVGRELWQCLLLGKLLPIFFRKRQKATSLTTQVRACPKSVKA